MIEYTGKLVEVGMLEEGMGLTIEVDGQVTTVIGMSVDDVRGLARHLYQDVRVQITAVSEEAST